MSVIWDCPAARFGRLVETIWKTPSAEQIHTTYGRNRMGGVMWQNNVKAHSLSVATQDNYYWYDDLQQVKRHDRGDLTPSSGPPYTGIDPTTRQQQEDFTFDETGNWNQFHTQSPALVQTRTHDTANQIASLTNPTSVVQPVYDTLGNMTTMPKAGDWTTSNTLKWDAWNRLVKLTEGSNNITYAYDAFTRRTIKTNSATSETRHYYYDKQWRAVEERVAGAAITVERQYTWSPLDRWTLIRRKRTVTTSLDETRFILKDYLDPAAIIDSSATVDERFGYDAFGKLNLMTPAFAARTTSVCDWNFLFHAEFQDLDSGLYNYGYRYYHAELGRWLSRDPIGEQGGVNLYGFVGNDGVRRRDFLGMYYTKTCEWPESTIKWLKEACPFIKALSARHGVDPQLLANSLAEERSESNPIVDAGQDLACQCHAESGNLLSKILVGLKTGRYRDADLGPSNIHLISAQEVLRERGWSDTKESAVWWLWTNEGTADIGAVLQKKASEFTKDVWSRGADPDEQLALQTNAWREGREEFLKRVSPNFPDPNYVPNSNNNPDCLHKRLEQIDDILKNCQACRLIW